MIGIFASQPNSYVVDVSSWLGFDYSRLMKRTAVLLAFSLGLLAAPFAVDAQTSEKIWRIGVLRSGVSSTYVRDHGAFLRGLEELGYVDGGNLRIEFRFAEGNSDRLDELVAELVRLKVTVIVVGGATVVRASQRATATIPIVVGSAGDLLKDGLVASLAKPGGNVTGSTRTSTELGGKRLELLKEIVPALSRVSALFDPLSRESNDLAQLRIAALALNIGIEFVEIRNTDDFHGILSAKPLARTDALVIVQGRGTNFNRRRLVELAIKNQLPSMCEAPSWTRAGCLMSYGPDQAHQWHRAAAYVDKILKGAKPADLPIEQPTKFELVVNLKTAKALGITIPGPILLRADDVIE